MSASSAGKKRKFSDESDAELEASSFKSGEQQSTVLQWNAPTLQENGIFYAVEPVGIQVIWDILKKDRYVQVVENPSVTGLFMAIMKKCLDFSIEIDSVFQNQDLESAWKWYDNRQIELDECMNLVTNLCWRPIDHVQEQCSISPLCSSDNQLCSGLLHIWLGHALEFLRSTKDLMMLVAEATDTHIKDNEKRNRKGKQSVSDGALADSFVPIAEYREIIMRYTRLLFLEPKAGDTSKAKITVWNEIVGCVPDVRYVSIRRSRLIKKLVLLIEVKRKALSKTPEKKTLVQSLKSEVLAQIGAELLAELPYSVFSNRSVGVLCMRTEIVFMMLDMSQTESQAIKVGSNIVNRKGKVMYTRSYDILKADDRQEVMGFLLWLAFVQKGNIQEFYGVKHSV